MPERAGHGKDSPRISFFPQSLLVRGTIARQLDLPEADKQIRVAEKSLDAIEKALEAGRALANPPRSRPAGQVPGGSA